MLTAAAFELSEIAVHYPWAIVPSEVPARAVIQLHWSRDRRMEELLAELGCRVVTLVRDPLDVYVSVVRFCAYEPDTARWLGGKHGDERAITGCGPNDEAAIAYGRSARFRSLLSVTPDWWDTAIGVRYEDAANDPATMVTRLSSSLGEVIRKPVDSLLDWYSFERLRAEYPIHCAVGPSGTWRDVLTESTVEALKPTLRWHLERFGYTATCPRPVT
jgi:hypothetical protein